jgi:hypothetical protein
MKKHISRTATLLTFLFLLLMALSTTNVFAVKLNKIGNPKEGYYYIYCGFGTGGDKLYYDSSASKKYIKWGKNGTVWYLRKDKDTGAYKIELAEDSNYFMHLRDGSSEIIDLPPDNRNYRYLWYFHDYGNNNYVIESGKNGSKAQRADSEYEMLIDRDDRPVVNDTVKLRANSSYYTAVQNRWKFHLEPTTYDKALEDLKAKILKIKVNRQDLIAYIKVQKLSGQLWTKVKNVEIQYSTDKAFKNDVKTKVVSKDSEKIVIKNLKRDTTYYIRARLTTAKGVTSRWSKTGSFTTRKE